PRMLAASRWGLRVALVLIACWLAGCSALPPRPPHPRSEAIAVDEIRSGLARQARSLLPPGSNGFHLLPEPEGALDARLELIQGAEQTLDLQYFSWNADESGLRILEAVRQAALRGVRVRVLLDHLYSGPIDGFMQDLAAQPNTDVRMFNPVAARAG